MRFLMSDYGDVRFFKGKRLFKKPKELGKQIKKQWGGMAKMTVGGIIPGLAGIKAGSWKPVGAGLAIAGTMLGGQALLGTGGLFGGGGGGLGGTLTRTIGPDGMVQYTTGGGGGGALLGGGGGGGGMGWLGKLGMGVDIASKVYGGYASAEQLKQANKLQRLQMQMLEGLGQVSPEEYQRAEQQYSTSMFHRGLGGSSLYGTGLSRLGADLQSAKDKERMYSLGIMNQ